MGFTKIKESVKKNGIQNILNDSKTEDETVVAIDIARNAPIIEFIISIALNIVGIMIVYWLVILGANLIKIENFNQDFLYSLIFIPLIGILRAVTSVLDSLFVEIGIGDKLIICKEGFYNKRLDKLYVKHIDNVEVHTTIFSELFNYGHITLYSFGGNINLPFVKDYQNVYFMIKNKIENAKKEVKNG